MSFWINIYEFKKIELTLLIMLYIIASQPYKITIKKHVALILRIIYSKYSVYTQTPTNIFCRNGGCTDAPVMH